MSLESLKLEIASLPLEGRNQLMGYLIDLRARETDPTWALRTAEALDDKSSTRWVPWDEVTQKLDAKDREDEVA